MGSVFRLRSNMKTNKCPIFGAASRFATRLRPWIKTNMQKRTTYVDLVHDGCESRRLGREGVDQIHGVIEVLDELCVHFEKRCARLHDIACEQVKGRVNPPTIST